MKARQAVVVLAMLLSVVACVEPDVSATPHAEQTSSPSDADPTLPQAFGSLAYIGSDGNVWVTSPGEGWTRPVTRDATAPPEGQGRSYHRVVWSRNGALSFAAVVRSGDDASGELFVQAARGETPERIARSSEYFFIYLYASPAACEEPSRCPSLAYLIEEANGVELHLVTVGDDGPQDLSLAVGRPFYLSWSPDGEEILWHTGGDLRDNPAAEIGLYTIDDDLRRILPYAPGTFQAPAWSPRGEAWLGVVGSGGVNRLQHVTPDGVATLFATKGRGIDVAWSPTGRRAAYAARAWAGASFYDPIQVVDVDSGMSDQVTDDAFAILAFFWSPDGERLAYLTRLDLPDDVWMQWRVFDLATGLDRGYTAFRPSPLMRFTIHSFSQYAQSHRFWSPDGRYLVYTDRDDGGADRVWLVDTSAEKGADPILVDEGSIGVWSWR